MPLWAVPLVVLGALALLLGVLALLSRIRGGRYVRPLALGLARVPLLRRGMQRMSRAALERSNPELASAMRKLERMNATRDPQRAQRVIGQLSPAERRAYLAAAQEQGVEPMNREQRRRAAKARRR